MGVKYVRMFGNRCRQGEPREAVFARVIEGFQKMAAYAKTAGVAVLIESHGDFTNSRDIEASSVDRCRLRRVRALWDAHHTFVAGHEAARRTPTPSSAAGSAIRT